MVDDLTKFIQEDMIDQHMIQTYAGVNEAAGYGKQPSGAMGNVYRPGVRESSNVEDVRKEQWDVALDEFDARKREERGEFVGYYTQGPDDNALEEANSFRGQSGTNKGMSDFLKTQTQSRLGGPEEQTVEQSKDLYGQLGDWIADNGPDNPGKFMAQVIWKLGDMFVADPYRAADSILKSPVKLPSEMTNREAAEALGKGVQAVGGALAGGIPAHAGEGLTGAYLGAAGGKVRLQQVEQSIERNTSRIAKLQEEVASDRFIPKHKQMKQDTIVNMETRLEKLYAEKEDLIANDHYAQLYMRKKAEGATPARSDISQKSPNFPAKPEDRAEVRMNIKDRKLLDKIESLEMTASMHKNVATRRAAREELEALYKKQEK